MSQILDVLLSPRFTSFYWRAGAMVGAGFLSLVSESLELFQLGPTLTLILGLVLGEITKSLNDASKGLPLGFSR